MLRLRVNEGEGENEVGLAVGSSLSGGNRVQNFLIKSGQGEKNPSAQPSDSNTTTEEGEGEVLGKGKRSTT